MTAKLEHKTYSIDELIHNYRQGRLVIPEFQRDYVWKPGRAPTLLDSLYQGFPISSLLVWESDGDVKTRRPAPRRASGPRTSWLIDGQQRVITLSRIANGDEGIDVVFNVKTEAFARVNAATKKDHDWLSVAEIWDDDAFRRLRRNLNNDAVEARLERVRAIRSYDVPAVHMVDHSFDEAVLAFTRINTLGVKLKQQDIDSAQVAARHSGFIRDHVAPTLTELRRDGFDRLDVGHLFRACAFLAHPDGRTRTPLHELSPADVKVAWQRTLKGLKEAQALLRNELGVSSMSLLWSGALLVPPIVLCATQSARERKSSEIAGWVALAALLHRYSVAAGTALDQDLRACRDSDPIRALLRNLRQHRPVLRAETQDFDAGLNDRGALFCVYVASRHRGLIDIFTQEKIALDRDLDRHHIFPRAQFMEKQRSTADVVANIAFIKGESNKSLGAPSPDVYLRKLLPKVTFSQCIPAEKGDWELDQSKSFWAKRRQLLTDSFNEYLQQTFPERNSIS